MPVAPKPQLTLADIEAESPADTALKAWETALDSIIPFKSQDDGVRRLSRPWRAVYTTFWRKREVENGGHDQLFWNSDGVFNAETQEDLGYIGAAPFLELFIQARMIYEAQRNRLWKRAPWKPEDGPMPHRRLKRMDRLDKAFFAETKQIDTILGEFIRTHPTLFTQ